MKAELRGAMEGLRLAWENNFRKVDVRVDSEAVISLITGKDNPMHQHEFQEWMKREWEVKLIHVFRKQITRRIILLAAVILTLVEPIWLTQLIGILRILSVMIVWVSPKPG
ncbi:hypothetical protein LINPERHAP1_LOCUS1680 [Linum perenne]